MKIRRIKLDEVSSRPLLNGLELTFPDDNDPYTIDPNCIIGVNGSGKSQFLETIAEIFYYLDKIFRNNNRVIVTESPCLFEIDYSINNGKDVLEIQIKQTKKKGKAPEVLVLDNEFNEVEISLDDIEAYLPSKVIGYTSGSNETLSIPFLDYYDEYATHTATRALHQENIINQNNDYDPRFYLMDYNTNKGVVISNLSLANLENSEENTAEKDESTPVEKVLNLISVKALRSFQLVVQTKHKAAKGKDGIQLTPEIANTVSMLKRIATSYDYDPVANAYVLDFYINKATREALRKCFGNPRELYTAIYKLELLNNLIIDKKYREEIKKLRKNRRLLTKPPIVPDQDKVLNYSEIKLWLKDGSLVDYISLSDGEHQFLNIFGTILMQDVDNSLFLLDEPETHFNPKWRREFVKLWNEVTIGRNQDNFITTHSPFVVSDCRKEKVFIFKKSDTQILEVLPPVKETYGSSFDFILQSAFDLENTLSEKSFEEIKELIESDDASKIEQRLPDFGESAEKFYLFKRIEEIKLGEDKNASHNQSNN